METAEAKQALRRLERAAAKDGLAAAVAAGERAQLRKAIARAGALYLDVTEAQAALIVRHYVTRNR